MSATRRSKTFVIAALLALTSNVDASPADADPCSGIEYRLDVNPDEPGSQDFVWWDGDPTRRLAGRAFLDAADFRAATLRPARSQPGRWDIDLVHASAGAEKFAAVGNADRERTFSIVVGGKIVQGFGFPPFHKDIYTAGSSAGGFPKDVAERLVREVQDAIDACKRAHRDAGER